MQTTADRAYRARLQSANFHAPSSVQTHVDVLTDPIGYLATYPFCDSVVKINGYLICTAKTRIQVAAMPPCGSVDWSSSSSGLQHFALKSSNAAAPALAGGFLPGAHAP